MQVTPWGPWNNQYQSAAGINVNPDSALNLLTVYGCVQLISDTIATLPRDVYRTLPDGTNQEVDNKPRWLEQPNPTTDIIEFLTQTLVSLLLDGNAYWAYAVDLNVAPTMLAVLNPQLMAVRDDGVDPTTGARKVAYIYNGKPFTGRLLHIKGLMQPGHIKGLSPVENARQSIGLGMATVQFAAAFYANGITPAGLVSTQADLTRDQAKKLAQHISDAHGGPGRSHLPMVLDNGAGWTQLSVTPEQAQFLATREFTAGEIAAQMFLVDPSMLGIAINRGQNLTYANLADRGTHLVQYTLMRWLIRLERAFTLLLPRPQFMKFNVDAIQRADLQARFNSYRTALGPNVPFMKVNEARDLEDLPPVPGGDTLPGPPAPTLAPFVPSSNGHEPATVGATQ